MSVSKKSILMLGGSRQQVVAIEKAKALGFRTVLCDYLPDNPGQFVADTFYQASTTDRELMLKIARKEAFRAYLPTAAIQLPLRRGTSQRQWGCLPTL